MVGSECGSGERDGCCACRRQLFVWKAVAGGRQECGGSIIWRCVDMQLCDYRETIVSVRISCDSGIAIKIFTHESATTAENLDFILILHVFLCGVCSWWSECERIQLCVMCWEAVVIVGVM